MNVIIASGTSRQCIRRYIPSLVRCDLRPFRNFSFLLWWNLLREIVEASSLLVDYTERTNITLFPYKFDCAFRYLPRAECILRVNN